MENYYFQQLYEQVQYQQQELNQLISSLNKLNRELDHIKKKPTIIVEKLEYKFDQLKVETLEGTLNIGLTPSDLEGIEEMSLPPKPTNDHTQLKEQLLNRVQLYLDEDVNTVIEETEIKVNKKLGMQYKDLIKADIQKQLPARVDHYIQQAIHQSQRAQDEQDSDAIYQQIIGDINRAIHAFISQLPQDQNNNKGDKK